MSKRVASSTPSPNKKHKIDLCDVKNINLLYIDKKQTFLCRCGILHDDYPVNISIGIRTTVAGKGCIKTLSKSQLFNKAFFTAKITFLQSIYAIIVGIVTGSYAREQEERWMYQLVKDGILLPEDIPRENQSLGESYILRQFIRNKFLQRYYKPHKELILERIPMMFPPESLVDETLCKVTYLTMFDEKYKSGNLLKSIQNSKQIKEHTEKITRDIKTSDESYLYFKRSYHFTNLDFSMEFLKNYKDRILCVNETNLFNYVPKDILNEIFTYLGSRELHRLMAVCKNWKGLLEQHRHYEISRSKERKCLQKKSNLKSLTVNDIPCDFSKIPSNLIELYLNGTPSLTLGKDSLNNITRLRIIDVNFNYFRLINAVCIEKLEHLHLQSDNRTINRSGEDEKVIFGSLFEKGINLKYLFCQPGYMGNVTKNNLNKIVELYIQPTLPGYYESLVSVPNPSRLQVLSADTKDIQNPKSLTGLVRFSTVVSPCIQDTFIQFENLRELHLRYNFYGIDNNSQQKIVSGIAQCKQLWKLVVSESITFDYERLAIISDMKISHLSIRYADEVIPVLPNVEYLKLSMIKRIPKKLICETLKRLDNLKFLHLPLLNDNDNSIFTDGDKDDWKNVVNITCPQETQILVNYFNNKTGRCIKTKTEIKSD